jgi:hypothetical protein
MKGMAIGLLFLLAMAGVVSCSAGEVDAQDLAGQDAEFGDGVAEDGTALQDGLTEVTDTVPTEATGTFTALTYNVAGLPEGVSGSHPAVNSPLISPLLNAYELVAVQEDFWYHPELSTDAEHAYQSPPMREEPKAADMGDGLNRFSVFPFEGHERVQWVTCSNDGGADCLTPKGFSFARHELAPGAFVDVYNLHADASSTDADMEARRQQYEQLLAFIDERSVARALMIMGDTNLKTKRPVDLIILEELFALFTDGCTALSCGDESIDRILLRDGGGLSLSPTSWEQPAAFVDAQGADLSDHRPVALGIDWTYTP